MKSALGTSLKAEQEAIKSRFERAETLLARPGALGASADNGEAIRVKRDSFTMPVADHEQIAHLQRRCLRAEHSVSKSEILRAGLLALATLSDDELLDLIARLPKVKTGRRPTSPV